jgi:5,10-methylenetetrahydromethanopterin reductase
MSLWEDPIVHLALARSRPGSSRVIEAVVPWRVIGLHTAYALGGSEAVDVLPGGAAWHAELEALSPGEACHLGAFVGHGCHLTAHDLHFLEQQPDGGHARDEIAGDPVAVRHAMDHLAAAGYCELMYNPSGPDVPRELRAFAAAFQSRSRCTEGSPRDPETPTAG